MLNWPPSGFPLPHLPPGPIEPIPEVPPVGIRVVAAWIAIFAAAAVMIQQAATFRRVAQTTEHRNDLQLDLTSRYAVGCKLLFEGTGAIPEANLRSLAAQVRAVATTPLDRLKMIPVIAELQDKAAAAGEARALLDQNPNEEWARDAAALRDAYLPASQPLGMEETRRLEDRYGWYGRLATSQVGADSAVVRPAVEAAAKRTAGTFFAVFGLCVPALIAGLVLFILFTAKWSNGTMRPRYAWGDPTDADALLEAFAVYLCAMAALTLGSRFLPDRATLAWNGLLVAPIAMALAWGWMRGLTGRRLAKAVGWNPGRGIAREMFAGIVGYVAGIPLIAAAIVVCLFLAKFSGTPASHPIEFEIENGGWDRVLLYLLACVFAPVVEELMFRGMLLRHLTARLSWFVSAIIVSVIFASVHPQGWTAIPVLAAIGMVLAMVRVQRDTLVASMTAHALNNFLFITLLVIAVG